MTDTQITRQLVPESQRLSITAELFGTNFPLLLEPAVFNFAGQLAPAYHGGLLALLSARQRRLLHGAGHGSTLSGRLRERL